MIYIYGIGKPTDYIFVYDDGSIDVIDIDNDFDYSYTRAIMNVPRTFVSDDIFVDPATTIAQYLNKLGKLWVEPEDVVLIGEYAYNVPENATEAFDILTRENIVEALQDA